MRTVKRLRSGYGLLNTAINRLPIELHLPGYRFCGPGTRLHKRLSRGDIGINPLDEACKQHDIAYDRYSDISARHQADRSLAETAFKRLRATDASVGERLAALAVGSAMKTKLKLGMGRRTHKPRKSARRKGKLGMGCVRKGGSIPFRKWVRKALNVLKRTRPIDIVTATKAAIGELKGLTRNVNTPRIIPVPKTGGFLPLIPIFAGLSALGALSGGIAGITKAVQDAKAAQQQLKESERHNRTMESIALGKGLYLKPYKKGMGLYLPRPKKNFR